MSNADTWQPWQREVVLASFLGWMLDAFDYFLVVFVLRRLATDFHTDIRSVTWAITLTLMMRPIGAFLFGRVADRYGRRPALMASVLLYSLLECASAFAGSLTVFIVLRALYGIAMGGEWGVGASLAFESVPVRSRGLVSGLLQAGYPTGYLVAGILYGLVFDHIGWRGMFIIGAAPALLVLYISARIPESAAWRALASPGAGTRQGAGTRRGAGDLWSGLAAHWPLALYSIVLMAAFNFFSHGTQDLYPTFLGAQRGFSTHTISIVTVVYNVGAIIGGLCFGRLSSVIGRRYAIALAAALALPVLPFWALAQTPLAVAAAAFAMQFMVQGAWGVVPVHLNELSPGNMRGTFPGVVYQLGNLVAASNATLQAIVAVHEGSSAHPDYAFALVLVCALTAVALLVLALAGPERRDVRLDVDQPPPVERAAVPEGTS
ncbi:MAG TPA: MFS transporter [Steroidobacteraceae bacterium]|nr:MFS transporter [Steroidobacteraceae bacterium]